MGTDLGKVKLKTLGTNEHAPAGYVCLGERWPAEGLLGRDRERVRKGIVCEAVDAYRHVRFEGDARGNIYVHLAQATAWLESYESGDSPQQRSSASPDCDSSAKPDAATATALATAVGLLARIADALESIATQPKACEPVVSGSWRDMNGECN